MWIAALAGRFAYFNHLASGHAVTWRRVTSQPDLCPGDIVCDECGQVLWCRAHDPWRVAPAGAVMPDHWGGTRSELPEATLFESFQRVLQLADGCPRGADGDAVRRAACELVESDSMRQRRARCRHMLKAIARLERSLAHRGHSDDSVAVLKQLTTALTE